MSAELRERGEVVATILALERSCLDADTAMAERRWIDAAGALSAQHSLTDQLRDLFARAPETAPDRDARVAARLQGVISYRDDQLRRLKEYNEECGRRLRSIAKLRAFARTVGRLDRRGNLYDTEQ